jgi:hypothetical protein
MPERIQMRRVTGWRKPAGAVYVGRPTKWGNPFPMQYWLRHGYSRAHAAEIVVENFRRCLLEDDEPNDGNYAEAMAVIRRDIRQLRGKDLACWCPLGSPCHADVLLEAANREIEP